MHATVEKLLVVDRYFLGFFPHGLGDAGHCLALLLVFENLLLQNVGGVEVDVEVVVELFLDEVADELCHRRPFGSHVTRAELGFGL